MHVKRRGNRKLFYRAICIKKNSEGNTHGFSRQHFVGSLSIDAAAIPPELVSLLLTDELAFVRQTVVVPAKTAGEASRKEAECRGRDPVWRLDEALP